MAFDPEALADCGTGPGARPITQKDVAQPIPFCDTTPSLLDGKANGGWLDLELPTGPAPKPRSNIGTRGQERGE
jgi:hypothetical protein